MKIKHLARIVHAQSRETLVDNIEIEDIQKELNKFNESLSGSMSLAPHCMPSHAVCIITIHVEDDKETV